MRFGPRTRAVLVALSRHMRVANDAGASGGILAAAQWWGLSDAYKRRLKVQRWKEQATARAMAKGRKDCMND